MAMAVEYLVDVVETSDWEGVTGEEGVVVVVATDSPYKEACDLQAEEVNVIYP